MYGNPLSPFNPYWWVGGPGPVIPARQRSALKQLCIFELPTTNVALSDTSVDYGIDACLYNQLPAECYITVQINQAVPTGGESSPVTIVTPVSGTSTNTGSTSGSGEKKTSVIDHNSSAVVGSDLTGSQEVLAYLNKNAGIIRFVNFQTGSTTAAATENAAQTQALRSEAVATKSK